MRVFALSDIHVDYEQNAAWIADVSTSDYCDDVLILAGDVTDSLRRLDWCLGILATRFKAVLYVPGNHDLWVIRDAPDKTSLEKFAEVERIVQASGVSMRSLRIGGACIVPLLGWYDYSFGQPCDELRSIWMDYRACRWPDGMGPPEVTAHFAAFNEAYAAPDVGTVITFSHFLPRIDVMPSQIPADRRRLYPILGASRLDAQLRGLNSSIHVYGHSHVNRSVAIDGVTYINNTFGYPHETWITSKRLRCIYEN